MVSQNLKLTKNEIKALSEYETILLKRFPKNLSKIILFGSKARGDSNPSSDLDLLIVLAKNGKSLKRLKREITDLTHKPILRFEVLLSPVVVEEKFLRSWSPLREQIDKDGITLWTKK